MNILFIHQNFPGQYPHLARALAQRGHRVVGLGDVKNLRNRPDISGVNRIGYQIPNPGNASTHQYIRDFEGQIRRGQQVVRSLLNLKEVIRDGQNGLLVNFFQPEAIVARIVEGLEHPTQMQALREAARQTIVERYDLHTVCLPQQLAFMAARVGQL